MKIELLSDLATKLEALDASLTNLNPEIEQHLKRLNTNLHGSSQKIKDYSDALTTLLTETQNTYSEVNKSLRENADFIRNELK